MSAYKYDFETVTDRRPTYASKWDVADGELPLSLADMEFKAAPEIKEALKRRLDNGIFGYTDIPDCWYEAYISWWRERHGLEIKKEDLIFCTGVVPAISSAVRKLTTPAEKVLIQTPVYNIFYNSILNNGRVVLENRLIYEDGAYSIDWEDFEEKLSDPQVSLMILCNPHNPIGKIWDKETLKRIGDLAYKHHVTVISDEIHCDITDPGKMYVPFASVSDVCKKISVTCIAPTKCFNLAGLQTAAVMASDPVLHHKMWRALNTDEVAEPSAFAVDAAVAAFGQAGPWLDEMRDYVYENKKLVRKALASVPGIKVIDSDATYLLWLDVSAIDQDGDKVCEHLRKTTGLILSKGSVYGPGGGAFLRLNTACPRSMMEDGIRRLTEGLKGYKA
ncbi:MAG: pyridoxal phosphate-dependent aminotransferase [Firmicutes bacterium]|nr:pyridoxal phosphate-dependent aminotransferase [Bacillota bacterium]